MTIKTPVIIIRGRHQSQLGFIYGDLDAINPHVTRVYVYPMNWLPGDPMSPGKLPKLQPRADLRTLTDAEKILFKVEHDNPPRGALFSDWTV